MDDRPMTKQDAYNRYAAAMARHDEDEAEIWWDIYFYWDDVETNTLDNCR